MTDFFSGYSVWTDMRFNAIVDFCGREFFKGKKLLEVGAATGDLRLGT